MLDLALPLAASDIDQVNINFSESSLFILAAVIGVIMFGIALDTKVSDFRAVAKMPKAMAVGIAAQFICLPAITYLLTLILGVGPSIALGMIVVACCPPGNISNILTYRAKGNVALGVSMTAISNVIAIVVMPLNIAFWGGLHPEASTIITEVDLSAIEMLLDILIVLGIPFTAGISIAHRFPEFAARVQPWVKKFSLIALIIFIVIAFFSNVTVFWDHIAVVAIAVFLHDSLALALGYGIATACRLEERNRRAVTFEVGVRNTGIGLAIVFNFFDGLGGMAMVAGWWGIWDLIAGLALASWWANRKVGSGKVTTE